MILSKHEHTFHKLSGCAHGCGFNMHMSAALLSSMTSVTGRMHSVLIQPRWIVLAAVAQEVRLGFVGVCSTCGSGLFTASWFTALELWFWLSKV